MEIKDNKQEKLKRTAITEVNSSIMLVSVRLVMCSEVITNKQNPKRFAAVFKICGEVELAMIHSGIKFSITSSKYRLLNTEDKILNTEYRTLLTELLSKAK